MADRTEIAWSDATVNPIVARRRDTGKLGFHCVKVSPECALCYAESFNLRNLPAPARGTGLPYTRAAGELVDMVLLEEPLEQLLRWERPRRVFPCSMTDICGEFVPSHFVQRCLDVFVEAGERRGHLLQVLTKRPERLLAEVAIWVARHGRPLPRTVQLGFSAGDRDLFDKRWPVMRKLRAPQPDGRPPLAEGPLWCSYEPAIGALVNAEPGTSEMLFWLQAREDGLEWVVWGGESGARARGFNAFWAVGCCIYLPQVGIHVFGKQWGRRPFAPVEVGAIAVAGALPGYVDGCVEVRTAFRDREDSRVVEPSGRPVEWERRFAGCRVLAKWGGKGGADYERWPEIVRRREFPA